jgi:beta-glucosidase
MYSVLTMPDVAFPDGFVWGSATAGHQIEGDNIHSQWWAWEQSGRLPWTPPGIRIARSGKACNSYALYRDDVVLLQELGHQAFRFSVEWSRIEPSEGSFDGAALEHYVDLAYRLKEARLRTFVTLHHFTHPLWFEERGGFDTLGNLPYFERYVERVATALAPYTDFWNVLNEFNLGGPDQLARKAATLRYHARGYHTIRRFSAAPISSAHAFPHFMPRRRNDVLDQTLAAYRDWIEHEFFFHAIRSGEIVLPYRDAEVDPLIKDTCDYWAVNYYTRHMIDARCASSEGRRFDHARLRLIPQDFYLEEFFPEGLIANLERLSDKPVYITENGVACDDDRYRVVYLALHLSALRQAMERGIDVRGYLHWSLLDNYEWGSFLPRFGLVGVDYKTFERRPKPSASFYREVIAGNGVTQALIRKYLPTLSL